MEHGLDTEAVAVVAACVVLWGLVASRLGRWSITAPMAFVAFGLICTSGAVSLVDIGVHSSTVREIAEVTLALVLFGDASRIDLKALRSDGHVPLRLLGIGLPLTIAVGSVVALLVSDGDLWIAALISAAVAPTDAALGASIMEDVRVPLRVRRDLNVESGLNDGIATPFVMFFIAGAAAATEVADSEGAGSAAIELAIGVAVGAAIGFLGGHLLRVARARGWGAEAFFPSAVLGLALLSYATAIEAGGNGFVAAFIGGMAFGTVKAGDNTTLLSFNDKSGELLSLLVWFLFGATMIGPAFEHVEAMDVVFVVLALTVVRMVPVAVSLIGTDLDRVTVAFVGWFGPRGLASVVFALIAVDGLEPDEGNRVLAVITLTIVFSVVAHGLTSSPLAARYGAHAARLDSQQPEHAPVQPVRTRAFAGTPGASTGAEDRSQ
jgi:NhaP-type Na+/H+ or K+/H+ antiporter